MSSFGLALNKHQALCEALYMLHVFTSAQQPDEIGNDIIPLPQTGNSRIRDDKFLVPGHTYTKWWSRN